MSYHADQHAVEAELQATREQIALAALDVRLLVARTAAVTTELTTKNQDARAVNAAYMTRVAGK